MTKQDWLAAKAALDAIEAERDALLAPTQERYMAAMERLDDIEGASGEFITYCAGCVEPLFDGDKTHNGGDVTLCEKCAPTYGDMLAEPEHFVDGDEEPLTPEAAKAIVDAHLEDGGALTDPMVSA